MSSFDRETLAECGQCGKQVMTLAGWPGPVAACLECDVWTNHNETPPTVIRAMITKVPA